MKIRQRERLGKMITELTEVKLQLIRAKKFQDQRLVRELRDEIEYDRVMKYYKRLGKQIKELSEHVYDDVEHQTIASRIDGAIAELNQKIKEADKKLKRR